MAGLWELPTRELVAAGKDSHGLWPPEWELEILGANFEELGALSDLSHAITKHRIRGQLLTAAWKSTAPLPAAEGLRWASVEECADLGLTGLTQKCLTRAGF